VTLTPHPLLVARSWNGRAIPLLPLWAVRPVQSLSVCTRVTFTFTYHMQVRQYSLIIVKKCKIIWPHSHQLIIFSGRTSQVSDHSAHCGASWLAVLTISAGQSQVVIL